VSKLRQFGHKCRDCRQVVPSGARVCPNCKAFQDWRRFVAIGQTNLALLTAIISVATTFLAVAIPFFKKQGYQIELFLVSTSETQISVVVRNTGNEGVLFSLRNLRIGNSDFNSSYFLVDLDHDGVYLQPSREEKVVAGFKSEVSTPLCEYMHQQAFFSGFKEIKDRDGTIGDAMKGVSEKIACEVGLHETSFNSSREFYFRPFDCGNFQFVNSCAWTELKKVFSE
jgi:RNA polymerase subunit RPABC4/transcription elongation factor Spt4